MTKVLYFEGAGMFGTGGPVGNCRIRSAFTADDGRRWYLEIETVGKSKEWLKLHPDFECVPYVGYAAYCHELTGDPEDCNKRRHPIERSLYFPYTLASIRNVVNSELGCSFDEVRVAPEFSRYRVHGERHGEYNLADGYEPDMALVAEAERIHGEQVERQRAAGVEHPCASVRWDGDEERLLHVRNYRKGGLEDFDMRF